MTCEFTLGRSLWILATAAVLAVPAWGQDTYPSKAITVVVPFPPGGVADIVARPAADAMSRHLKQPVVIENKPGAGGGIGMGYVVAVRADSPWQTLQEFVADAKRRPGAITYGSSGNYGTMHMPMEMFAERAGIKLLHVPYTGGGPAVVGLLGGNVDAISTGPSTVIQHVKAGKVRVLASWGDKRLASLPDVPTLSESGVDAVFFQWSALFAPAATPEPVLAKLREAARAVASDRAFVTALSTVETPVQYLDAPEMQRFWEADARKLGEAVRRVGKLE